MDADPVVVEPDIGAGTKELLAGARGRRIPPLLFRTALIQRQTGKKKRPPGRFLAGVGVHTFSQA